MPEHLSVSHTLYFLAVLGLYLNSFCGSAVEQSICSHHGSLTRLPFSIYLSLFAAPLTALTALPALPALPALMFLVAWPRLGLGLARHYPLSC